jgi:cytochrome c oxidase assembly protein subunit 15
MGVILWGAYVRVSDSGDGCGRHWPTCHGQLVPVGAGARTSPATWVEFIHRVTSGISFVMVWAQAMMLRRRRGPRALASRYALVAGGLMVTEALVGAGLVLFELVARNTSMARAYWMGAHLVNTFVLLGFLVAVLYQLYRAPDAQLGNRYYRIAPRSWLILAGVCLVGVSGAVAALGDTLFPAHSLSDGLRQDFQPTAHALVRVRGVHPALAVVVGGWVMVWARMQACRVSSARPWALRLAALTALQLALGVVNLVLLAPGWMQLVHLWFADLLWLVLVVCVLEVSRDAGLASGGAHG